MIPSGEPRDLDFSSLPTIGPLPSLISRTSRVGTPLAEVSIEELVTRSGGIVLNLEGLKRLEPIHVCTEYF
jgi:hypothetical protein